MQHLEIYHIYYFLALILHFDYAMALYSVVMNNASVKSENFDNVEILEKITLNNLLIFDTITEIDI